MTGLKMVKCALLTGCMASTALSVAQDRRPAGNKPPMGGQPGASVQAPAGQLIWRARLKLVTADVNDAGSDDDLKVTLVGGNLPPHQSVLSETYLDRRADDREQGCTDWYDLRLQGLITLGELREIRFEKRGADGWAMHSWMLEINGHPLAGDTTGVLWFEKGGDYSLQHAFAISAQAKAALPPTSQPRRFDAAELRGRIEASFGHAMQAMNGTADDLTWRGTSEDIGCQLSLENQPPVIESKPARIVVRGIPHFLSFSQAAGSGAAGSLPARLRSR
jgi:hypothetical protein